MFICHVGIYLCRADIAVSEHRLDTSEIGPVHKQVGGKAVAHGVGADMFGDTGETGILIDGALDTARR